MSLTKATYSMISGSPINVFDYFTPAQIAAVQAGTVISAAEAATLTASIHTALAAGNEIYFPEGTYYVTTVVFGNPYQTVHMNNLCFFQGAATGAAGSVDAVVKITARRQTFWGLHVGQNYNLTYVSAIQFISDGVQSPPQFINIFDLVVSDAKIGILYGAVVTPTPAAVSENHIYGITSVAVERVIYSNQPNGFLFVHGGTLVTQAGGWAAFPGNYSSVTANLVENHIGVISLIGCELVKNTSNLGYGMVNFDILNVENCTAEIISINFFCAADLVNVPAGGRLSINGYRNYTLTTKPVIGCASNVRATIVGTNIIYDHTPAGANTSQGLIDTDNSSTVSAYFTGVSCWNQFPSYFFTSAYPAPLTLGAWTLSDVRISNSVVDKLDPASAGTVFKLNMSEPNLASYFESSVLANWDITVGGAGNSVTSVTVNNPNFVNAIQVLYAAGGGAAVKVTTKKGIDQSIKSPGGLRVLEATMRSAASSTTFKGFVVLFFWDNAGAACSVPSVQLSLANYNTAHIVGGQAGLQDWETARIIFQPPLDCYEIQVQFGAEVTDSTYFQIGGLKVY